MNSIWGERDKTDLMAQLYVEAMESLTMAYTYWVETPVKDVEEDNEALSFVLEAVGEVLKAHTKAQAEGRI